MLNPPSVLAAARRGSALLPPPLPAACSHCPGQIQRQEHRGAWAHSPSASPGPGVGTCDRSPPKLRERITKLHLKTSQRTTLMSRWRCCVARSFKGRVSQAAALQLPSSPSWIERKRGTKTHLSIYFGPCPLRSLAPWQALQRHRLFHWALPHLQRILLEQEKQKV